MTEFRRTMLPRISDMRRRASFILSGDTQA